MWWKVKFVFKRMHICRAQIEAVQTHSHTVSHMEARGRAWCVCREQAPYRGGGGRCEVVGNHLWTRRVTVWMRFCAVWA